VADGLLMSLFSFFFLSSILKYLKTQRNSIIYGIIP